MDATPVPMPARRGTPALVWLLWALGAAATVQLAPNPIYVTLVVLTAGICVQAHRSEGPLGSTFPLMVGAGVAFGLLRLVLNALTTHGTGDVLFVLPEATLPEILGGFTIGGTIEAPVVAQAAAEGWAIVGILAAFGAFNAVVSHYELVRMAPRSFHELGLAVTVALAFIPSTIASVASVREADLARTGGRVVRRGRLVRQVTPVLESGMERAVALAESMDSRGFARDPAAGEAAATWLGLGGIASLAGTFIALVGEQRSLATTLAALGATGLLAAIVASSRASRRSTYRRRKMTRFDWLLTVGPVAAPTTLGVLSAAGHPTLRWPGEAITGTPPIAVAPIAAVTLLALTPLLARRAP